MGYTPRVRHYTGLIVLDSQPLNWISEHRSFASREWFRSQVEWGQWEKDERKRNCFVIYVTVPEGIKELTILIKIKYSVSYVRVYFAHVLRKSK